MPLCGKRGLGQPKCLCMGWHCPRFPLAVAGLHIWEFYGAYLLATDFQWLQPPFRAACPWLSQPCVLACQCAGIVMNCPPEHCQRLPFQVPFSHCSSPVVFAPSPHTQPSPSTALPDPWKVETGLVGAASGQTPQEGMQRLASLGKGTLVEQDRASGWDVLGFGVNLC